jgi:hypothetical protein
MQGAHGQVARRIGLAAVAAATAVALTVPVAPGALAVGETSTPYVNPVSKTIPADTFADPSLIRGKDGYWYAYGTSDPLCEKTNPDPGCTTEDGGAPPADAEHRRAHRIPIAKSADLVTWKYAGDAFSDPGTAGGNFPSWAADNAGLWGPDIRYVDGQYRLYYVVTETVPPGGTDEPNDNAIGMATAPTPVGPWTDSGGPVVGPRRGGQVGDGNFKWTFDPSAVTDRDGTQWLFYGSYYGGIFVTKLTDDGTKAVGEPTMVAIDNKFEGAYVVRRGGYWYLFASTANCCAGPTTGYSVQVGRSTDLRGPYVDREGVSLLASRAGGSPTLNQNGNKWIGAGHNAVVTDLSGQDWIVYHALDRSDAYLDGTDGINERPMLMDRLDWVGGWPYVRADQGPSEDTQPGPVSGGPAFTRFEEGIRPPFRTTGAWSTAQADTQSGRYADALRNQSTITAPVTEPGKIRAEGDVRGAAGIVLGVPGSSARTEVWVDPDSRTLQAHVLGVGERRSSAPLPANYRPSVWHSLSVEVRAGRLHAELSHARLGDPLAVLDMALPAGAAAARDGGAIARAKGADVDNLSVLTAFTPVTQLVEPPVPATPDPAASDEFDGSSWNAGWTFEDRNADPNPTVAGGELVWPVENADLNGPNRNSGLLLREPPSQRGDWTIETRLSIDLGENEILNYQQGGLVTYVDDDLFTRLSHVAIWNTRQTEFGKEMPYAGRLVSGGTIVGPPGATTYLRIVHHFDAANNEHELRAWTKREGGVWVKGGVWTLPGDAHIRVGLVSQGRQTGDRKTSRFDYFRSYTD